MASWLGDLASLGVGGGAIYGLLEQLKSDRGDVMGGIEDLKGQVGENIQFNPYSITSGMGSFTQGPEGSNMSLSGPYGRLSNQMLAGAGDALGQSGQSQDYLRQMLNNDLMMRATGQGEGAYGKLLGAKDQAYGLGSQYMDLAGQDPTQREGDVYNRIRAMQRPEEQRQQDQMNANLFGSGRGGMFSSQYGGTPEQHAFGKAQAEARNTASMNAMQQAQQEMMNYGNMANQFTGLGSQLQGQKQNLMSQSVADAMGLTSGIGGLGGQGAQTAAALMGGAMSPYQQMQSMAGLGQKGQEMLMNTNLNRMNMLGDLTLGGLGTQLNYSNIMGNLAGQAIPGLMSAASGLGSSMQPFLEEGASGLWDTLSGWF